MTISHIYVNSIAFTYLCDARREQGSGKMANMGRKPPNLSDDASPQAKAIHAFLVARQLVMSEWVRRAGLSTNILTNLFAGRAQSLHYDNVKSLAQAEDVTPEEMLGTSAYSDMAAAQLAPDKLVPINCVRGAVTAWAVKNKIKSPIRAVKEIEAIIFEMVKEGLYS